MQEVYRALCAGSHPHRHALAAKEVVFGDGGGVFDAFCGGFVVAACSEYVKGGLSPRCERVRCVRVCIKCDTARGVDIRSWYSLVSIQTGTVGLTSPEPISAIAQVIC